MKTPLLSCLIALIFSSSVWADDYTVTTTADSGEGSFRQAIIDANANAGPDVIKFAIPGAGPFKIAVGSPLPAIIDKVTIDGFTQAGEGVHAIELSGEALPAPHVPIVVVPVPNPPIVPPAATADSSDYAAGLILWSRDRSPGLNSSPALNLGRACLGANVGGCKLNPNPDGSVIRGLTITKFPKQAIYLYGADDVTIVGNYIGLDTTGNKSGYYNARQNLAGYPHDAIRIEGSSNNFIGTTADAYPDGYDVVNRNVIGSTGRVFIGMHPLNENGYGFSGCPSAVCRRINIAFNNNVLQGNYLGTNAAGTCIIGGVIATIVIGGVPVSAPPYSL